MLDHISTLEQLESEALTIQDFLSITCSEEMAEVVQRGNDLVVYIARTGKMLADCGWHRDKATSESIIAKLNVNLSAMILKRLIETECKRENYIYLWVERLNRASTHQYEWCRSLLSKAKAEMQYQNMNG